MPTIASILAAPLTVAESLDRLQAANVSTSSKFALRSVALDAVRHLRQRAGLSVALDDVMSADINPYLSILNIAAKDAAVAKELTRPSENASRASQFVEILTGLRPSARRFREVCPAAFSALAAIRAERHANGQFAYLARLCLLAGHADAPRSFPSFDVLLQAAENIRAHGEVAGADTGAPRKRVHTALSAYRVARAKLIDLADPKARPQLQSMYAPVGKFNDRGRICHVGTEREVQELLRSQGGEPELLKPFEVLRKLNPELDLDVQSWLTETAGRELSPSMQMQVRSALARIAGWLVRAGLMVELRSLKGVDELFERCVQTDEVKRLNSRAARRAGLEEGPRHELVSILEFAMDREAQQSLARSTVTTVERAGHHPDGKPWLTDAICRDIDCIWTITMHLYKDTRDIGDEQAARWGLILARFSRIQEQIETRRLPKKLRLTSKDKLRMIRTVTLPQLVCVALPSRRREIHALRERWLAAQQEVENAGHEDVNAHKAVRGSYGEYFDAAVPFTMLAFAVDDGLRRQQYTHGCLGFEKHFRPQFVLDEFGCPNGIKVMHTTWQGDLTDNAHLKITEKGGVPQCRSLRDLRPGIVDYVFLWDIISVWRPRQLERAGAIPSVGTYRLLDDLKTGLFALFPTSSPAVADPSRPRSDISGLAGRELHYVVRKFLRPELPRWDDLDSTWRFLWSIHITRLLIATYWGGVRKEWDEAAFQTMDTKKTLEKNYVVLDSHITDQCGLDLTNWEHPKAYDQLMDRLCKGREKIDLLDVRDIPLPPHLTTAPLPSVVRSRHRVRRARPGQPAPVNRPALSSLPLHEAVHGQDPAPIGASDDKPLL